MSRALSRVGSRRWMARGSFTGGGDALPRAPLKAFSLLALLFAFLLLSSRPARAGWTVTATVVGHSEWGGIDRDGNAYFDEVYLDAWEDLIVPAAGASVSSPGWGPGLFDSESYWDCEMTVTFRLTWEGEGPPQGLSAPNHDQIKVLLRGVGECHASAQADVWDDPPEVPHVGTADSSAAINTSLGNVSLAAHAGEGHLTDTPAPVRRDWQEVRTLTVADNVAETVVELHHHEEASEHGGTASAEGPLNASAWFSLVALLAPSPHGRPEMGDNEYDFGIDNAMPLAGGGIGNRAIPLLGVTIPCLTTVIEGDRSSLAEQGKLEWTCTGSWTSAFERIYPNWLVPDSTWIQPRTVDPDAGLQFLTPGLSYGRQNYLPANNTDFGLRTVTMQLGPEVNATDPGSATAEPTVAQIEVFWPATDRHHPIIDPIRYGDAVEDQPENWFYYYKQVYPVDEAHTWYDNAHSFYDWGTDKIHLFDAHGRDKSFPVFYRGTGGRVQKLTMMWLTGIHWFVRTYEHEKGHRDARYSTGQPYGAGTDGDGLRDLWETTHGLDPEDDDTTDAYENDTSGTPGDAQLVADVQAYGVLVGIDQTPGYRDLWEHDWASDGMQRGTPPIRHDPPPDGPTIVLDTTRFPWYYYNPATPETPPTSEDPGNALKAILP